MMKNTTIPQPLTHDHILLPAIAAVRSSVVLAVFSLLLPMMLSGCISSKPGSPVADSLDSLGITIRGIRESNLRLASREGLTIERAADSIIAISRDHTTKLNAYLWKIYCIPVIRQIYSESDPLLSATDALAFTMQCREYFIHGIGRDRFGPYQRIAVAAVNENEQRLIDLNRQRLTKATFDSLMRQLSRWAAEHPLSNHVFERPSMLNELDKLLAGQDYSIPSVVGRIADDVDDLSGRISLLSAQFPREARWQAEYVLAELSLRERLGRLDSTMTILSVALANVDQSLKSGGLEVRIGGLLSLRDDLHEALSKISTERSIVTAEIERIRLATLAAAEEAANRAVAGWLGRIESIVDRTLLKLGLLIALVLAVATALILSLRRARRV